MRKVLAPAAIALAALSLAGQQAAAESSTIRIEERPYYGAVVTLEAGVRVYRPLPPHSKIVINPGGRTPLNLTYEERRSVSHNYVQGAASSAYAEARADAGDGHFYPIGRPRKPHHHHGGVLTGNPGHSPSYQGGGARR